MCVPPRALYTDAADLSSMLAMESISVTEMNAEITSSNSKRGGEQRGYVTFPNAAGYQGISRSRYPIQGGPREMRIVDGTPQTQTYDITSEF